MQKLEKEEREREREGESDYVEEAALKRSIIITNQLVDCDYFIKRVYFQSLSLSLAACLWSDYYLNPIVYWSDYPRKL